MLYGEWLSRRQLRTALPGAGREAMPVEQAAGLSADEMAGQTRSLR